MDNNQQNQYQQAQRGDPNAPTINLPMREMTTQQQLSSLLGVAGFMWSALHRPQNPFGDPDARGPETRLSSEVTVAAQSSFIKACAAIDVIVEDTKRWDSAFQDKIEKDYAHAMDMNLEYIRAQRDAMKEYASPHHVLNPALTKLPNGSWMAYVGNPNDSNNSVIGIGQSPQECLEAFDIAFKGTAEQIKNEKPKQVDRPSDSATQEPPKRRRIYPRNRENPGEAGANGGEQNI